MLAPSQIIGGLPPAPPPSSYAYAFNLFHSKIKKHSAIKETQLVSIGISTICLFNYDLHVCLICLFNYDLHVCLICLFNYDLHVCLICLFNYDLQVCLICLFN